MEKDIKRVVVHEVSGISRCFLGDENGPQGTEFHLKTEGINMHVSNVPLLFKCLGKYG